MNSLALCRQAQLAQKCLCRNFGASAVLSNPVANDAIQKLFLEKVQEYKQKSKSSSDGLFEASPSIKAELASELKRAATQYGGSGDEMAKFPQFNFKEPAIDPQLEEVH